MTETTSTSTATDPFPTTTTTTTVTTTFGDDDDDGRFESAAPQRRAESAAVVVVVATTAASGETKPKPKPTTTTPTTPSYGSIPPTIAKTSAAATTATVTDASGTTTTTSSTSSSSRKRKHPDDDDNGAGSDDDPTERAAAAVSSSSSSSAPAEVVVGEGGEGAGRNRNDDENQQPPQPPPPSLQPRQEQQMKKKKRAQAVDLRNRERNREHARKTRLRKKAYLADLQAEVADLRARLKANELGSLRAEERLRGEREVRFLVLEELLRLRGLGGLGGGNRGVVDPIRWTAILDEGFTLTLPVTRFRPMVHDDDDDREEHDKDKDNEEDDHRRRRRRRRKQVLTGASEVMRDSELCASFLRRTFGTATATGKKKMKKRSSVVALEYECDRDSFFVNGCTALLDWTATVVVVDGDDVDDKEPLLVVEGHARAVFCPDTNKLRSAVLTFDTGAVVSQIEDLGGATTVTTTTVPRPAAEIDDHRGIPEKANEDKNVDDVDDDRKADDGNGDNDDDHREEEDIELLDPLPVPTSAPTTTTKIGGGGGGVPDQIHVVTAATPPRRGTEDEEEGSRPTTTLSSDRCDATAATTAPAVLEACDGVDDVDPVLSARDADALLESLRQLPQPQGSTVSPGVVSASDDPVTTMTTTVTGSVRAEVCPDTDRLRSVLLILDTGAVKSRIVEDLRKRRKRNGKPSPLLLRRHLALPLSSSSFTPDDDDEGFPDPTARFPNTIRMRVSVDDDDGGGSEVPAAAATTKASPPPPPVSDDHVAVSVGGGSANSSIKTTGREGENTAVVLSSDDDDDNRDGTPYRVGRPTAKKKTTTTPKTRKPRAKRAKSTKTTTPKPTNDPTVTGICRRIASSSS